tara:strand:+ start:690 stop:1268 length:579 start_codon:yes stop_codon:yes gene_type:complete
MTFKEEILSFQKILEIIESDFIESKINEIANSIVQISKTNKVIAIFGNGGSASDSNHLAGELVCTFSDKNRRAINAVSLVSNPSVMTAWSNDVDFEFVFSRQIEALNTSLGMAIGLSTSGKSKNVLSGLKKAKEYGSKTVLITGLKPNNLEFIDIIISFPSNNTGFVQTLTQLVYHSICKCIDQIELSINGE